MFSNMPFVECREDLTADDVFSLWRDLPSSNFIDYVLVADMETLHHIRNFKTAAGFLMLQDTHLGVSFMRGPVRIQETGARFEFVHKSEASQYSEAKSSYTNSLTRLIRKWRNLSARDSDASRRATLTVCADELERALLAILTFARI